MKSIIFISPPSAGKGTQSKLISDEYNIPHISVGSLLREVADSDSEIGHQLRDVLISGQLVDNKITSKILKNRLMDSDCNNGYILDGFPRSMEQAIYYEELLKELNKDLGLVIFLDISKELATKRALSRLMCSNCGSSYNLEIPDLRPKKDNICDRCGNTLSIRSDDNKESFEKRFDVYMNSTNELIDYYEKKGVLRRVLVTEGKSAIDIFEEIKEIINND